MAESLIAYYSGHCSPAKGPDTCLVKIQWGEPPYGGMSPRWETVYHRELAQGEFCGRNPNIDMARVILTHYLGQDPEESLIEKLVDWPGHSICRLTPADLAEFISEHGQMELF